VAKKGSLDTCLIEQAKRSTLESSLKCLNKNKANKKRLSLGVEEKKKSSIDHSTTSLHQMPIRPVVLVTDTNSMHTSVINLDGMENEIEF
jgi:hypothetical protein